MEVRPQIDKVRCMAFIFDAHMYTSIVDMVLLVR